VSGETSVDSVFPSRRNPGGSITLDTKEKQVNIPVPDQCAVGDLNAISEAGDVAGNRERGYPSLLRLRVLW